MPAIHVQDDAVGIRVANAAADLLGGRRRSARLSQGSLGEAVGRSQRAMARLEQGSARLTVLGFVDLALALGEDPRDLFQSAIDAALKEAGEGPGWDSLRRYAS